MPRNTTLLLYPSYFSPIIQYVAIAGANELQFEVEDNYQKQTYRTRCYIYGANGKQLLNIPVKNANHKQKTREIEIEDAFPWKQQHLKSIASAYRSSPFFEYYEDELHELFQKPSHYLLDFNFQCQQFIFDCLQINPTFSQTTSYEKAPNVDVDLRKLINAKSDESYDLDPYTQVFHDKHGFIPNLSVLDLLFSEGPNATQYLESQEIILL